MADANRTEQATPKRRRDARKKGQIPRSKEVPSALTFVVVVLFFLFAGSYVLAEFRIQFLGFWGHFDAGEFTILTAQQLLTEVLWGVMKLAGPLLLLILTVSLGGTVVQGGFVFSSEPLKIKGDKLNPAKNVKKIFSKTGIVELLKSLALVVVLTYLAASAVWERIDEFQAMVVMDLATILATWASILYTVSLRVGIFLAILAAADYLFQRYKFEEDLKQTRQEVRDDYKETEGDPLVKGRIRRLQKEMARKRMMAAVKTADVVVTNPTHYAVALRYDVQTMAAPRVVAKGKGYLAQKIKELAREHKIPMVESVALAQTLYKTVELDQEVPASLYKAVAQILAYVYKLKQER